MNRQLKTNDKGLLEDEKGKSVAFSEVEIGDFIDGARVNALGDIDLSAKDNEHNSETDVGSTSSTDNASPASADLIDDLHEQNPELLDKSLDKKEKGAQYQTAQKEKREAEKQTEKKSRGGGLISLIVVVVVFIGGFIFYSKNKGTQGVKEDLRDKKTEPTGNLTGNSNGKTGQETGTMTGVFNNG